MCSLSWIQHQSETLLVLPPLLWGTFCSLRATFPHGRPSRGRIPVMGTARGKRCNRCDFYHCRVGYILAAQEPEVSILCIPAQASKKPLPQSKATFQPGKSMWRWQGTCPVRGMAWKVSQGPGREGRRAIFGPPEVSQPSSVLKVT